MANATPLDAARTAAGKLCNADLFDLVRGEITDRFGDNVMLTTECDRLLDAVDALDLADQADSDNRMFDAPAVRSYWQGNGWMGSAQA